MIHSHCLTLQIPWTLFCRLHFHPHLSSQRLRNFIWLRPSLSIEHNKIFNWILCSGFPSKPYYSHLSCMISWTDNNSQQHGRIVPFILCCQDHLVFCALWCSCRIMSLDRLLPLSDALQTTFQVISYDLEWKEQKQWRCISGAAKYQNKLSVTALTIF